MSTSNDPLGQPLRLAALGRDGVNTRGLALLQLGSELTELVNLLDITTAGARASLREQHSIAAGHDAFEARRLEILCAGWHLDIDTRAAWRQHLGALLDIAPAALNIDMQQRSTPIGAREREVGPAEFERHLRHPATLTQMCRTGRWGLLTTTDHGLYEASLPNQVPSGVRWQECLGDIGGVRHTVPFTALFRIAPDGVCALVDLLGYEGEDLRKGNPHERFALLRELISELTGAGARFGAWQMPDVVANAEKMGEIWRDLAILVPGSDERVVLADYA